MKVLCVFGRHNYGDPARGLSYEYVHFIPALERLGHEMSFFECWDKSCYQDFSDLNRKLLQTIAKEKPDLILFVLMTYEIWLETLQIIRDSSSAALLHWATDDSWKYEQFSRFLAPSFDTYATTYPSAIEKAAADGLNHVVLTQWAADSGRMKDFLPADQCTYQVSFVGSCYGNRPQWINLLKQRGIHVDAFGFGWPNGPVAVEDIGKIMRQSMISLNFGDSGVVMKDGKPVRNRQIKARVFEVPGAGGLLMTEQAEYLDQYFRLGEEVVVFEGLDDLVQKINDLLTHPEKRDVIAAAGYERSKTEHSYESRFAPLIQQAIARRKMRVTTTYEIDFEQFETVAKSHRRHPFLLVLKFILVLPCMLIWGKQRGHRAARRFLFEFSWRYMGKKTYSASGWVGRAFYKQS